MALPILWIVFLTLYQANSFAQTDEDKTTFSATTVIPGFARFSGHIVDSDDVPVEGVLVQTQLAGSRYVENWRGYVRTIPPTTFHTRSKSDGSFDLGPVPQLRENRSVEAVFIHKDFAPTLITQSGTELTVQLKKGLQVTGQILGDAGTPLANAEVSAAFSLGHFRHNAFDALIVKSDETGSYKICLPEGAQPELEVRHPDYQSSSTGEIRISVEEQQDSTDSDVKFDLQLTRINSDEDGKSVEGPAHRVRGRVVSSRTGQPIEGARVVLFPSAQSDSAQVTENSPTPDAPRYTSSDQNGDFELAAPIGDVTLKVIGEVSGFVFLPYGHPDVLPDAVASIFVRKITLEQGKEPAPVEFQLRPAIEAQVLVLGSDGNPAPNILFVATHFTSGAAEVSKSIGVTDENGKLSINTLFDDALFVYDQFDQRTRENLAEGAIRYSPDQLDQAFKANRIWLYNRDLTLGAVREVRLEEARSKLNENRQIELTVQLEPLIESSGFVTDETSDQAIPGVDIEVIFRRRDDDFSLPIVMASTTRANGEFRLKGMFPGQYAGIEVEKQYFRYRGDPFDRFQVAQQNGFELPKLTGIDYSPLFDNKLVPPDLSGLADDAALERLSTFATEQLRRIPQPATPFRSSSSSDPEQVFRTLIARTLEPKIDQLIDSRSDEFRARVYLNMINTIDHPLWSGYNEVDWYRNAMKAFKQELVDYDGVFEFLLKKDAGDVEWFKQTVNRSAKPEIKAWACYEICVALASRLTRGERLNAMSGEEFQNALDDLIAWGEKFSQEHSKNYPGSGEEQFRTMVGNIERELKNGAGVARLIKVRAKIKNLFLEKPGS